MDKLKLGSGKRLRTEALAETALPVPYDAAAMPGASLLGTDGRIYTSIKIGETYQWSKAPASLSTGELLLGEIASPRTDFLVSLNVGGVQFVPALQIEGEAGEASSLSMISTGTDLSDWGPRLLIGKARGQSGAVENNDPTAILLFMGHDGTNLIAGAGITTEVDGTPATADMPMELYLRTRQQGAAGPARRVTITPTGNVLINNTTGTERLSVTGNIQLTSTSGSYRVGTNNVVGSRKTGWANPTGTATRTAFDTATVAVSDLAQRVKALIDDLTSHGLIGA